MRIHTLRRPKGDGGAAMLTVVMVGIVLTGMGLALTRTSLANLDNSGRDRVSSSALGIAEAGVAGAIDHIRGAGVHHLCAGCPAAWNQATPQTLTFAGGAAAQVGITELQRYQPPASKIGRYLIRAVGTTTGATPGSRTIEQEITVEPFDFPLGVYTAAQVNLQGTVKIQQESFFSGQCIDNREKMQFVAGPGGSYLDPYNDIPAGAHSATYIKEKNGACAPGKAPNDALHVGNNCHETYWADQSSEGGPYTSGTCAGRTSGKGDYGTAGSHFDMDVLHERYGFRPTGLTEDQFALLKIRAAAAGTYFPASRPFKKENVPPASAVPGSAGYKPIIYIEGQDVSLTTHLDGYEWIADPACTQLHPSVLLIVRDGDLDVGSNTDFTGNIFAPEGYVKYAGGAQLVGTLFARELTFTGNGQMGLNDCAAKTTHGGLLSIGKSGFRELDH